MKWRVLVSAPYAMSHLDWYRQQLSAADCEMIVADVMTRHVLSVAPDATVDAAAKLMLERGISGLFVVDAKGDVADVTIADVLQSNGVIHVIDSVLLP